MPDLEASLRRVNEMKTCLLESTENDKMDARLGAEMELALQILHQIIESNVIIKSDRLGYSIYRDSCMAANLVDLQNMYGGCKCIVWAHNGHINSFAVEIGERSYQTLGYRLRESLGDDFYNIGFGFSHGSFGAADSKTGDKKAWTIEKPLKKSVGWYLGALDQSDFFFDWNTVLAQPLIERWNRKPHKYHQIGAGYSYHEKPSTYYLYNRKPSDLFDGWLFFRHTTAAQAIVNPHINAMLDLELLSGKQVKIQAFVKGSGEEPPSHTSIQLYCWTQHSTLSQLKSKAVYLPEKRCWQLTVEGKVHPDTEILKFSLWSFQEKQLELDDLKFQYVGENGLWKSYPKLTLNFEQETDLDHIDIPESIRAERTPGASIGGSWGLRISVQD